MFGGKAGAYMSGSDASLVSRLPQTLDNLLHKSALNNNKNATLSITQNSVLHSHSQLSVVMLSAIILGAVIMSVIIRASWQVSAVILSVVMLSAIMLSAIMLSAIMLSVIMLSAFIDEAECHHADCHHTEYCYAECHHADCRSSSSIFIYCFSQAWVVSSWCQCYKTFFVTDKNKLECLPSTSFFKIVQYLWV
jgi:hypothetical protein